MSEPANHAQLRVEDVPLIVRREIEALAIAPLYEAFVRELGRERADAVVESAVAEMGTAAGKALAAEKPEGVSPLAYYHDVAIPRFSAGDAMEWSRIELDEEAETLEMDATRCEFAEMYRRLGSSTSARCFPAIAIRTCSAASTRALSSRAPKRLWRAAAAAIFAFKVCDNMVLRIAGSSVASLGL